MVWVLVLLCACAGVWGVHRPPSAPAKKYDECLCTVHVEIVAEDTLAAHKIGEPIRLYCMDEDGNWGPAPTCAEVVCGVTCAF